MTEDEVKSFTIKLAVHYNLCESSLSRWRFAFITRLSKKEEITRDKMETEVRAERRVPSRVPRLIQE